MNWSSNHIGLKDVLIKEKLSIKTRHEAWEQINNESHTQFFA